MRGLRPPCMYGWGLRGGGSCVLVDPGCWRTCPRAALEGKDVGRRIQHSLAGMRAKGPCALRLLPRPARPGGKGLGLPTNSSAGREGEGVYKRWGREGRKSSRLNAPRAYQTMGAAEKLRARGARGACVGSRSGSLPTVPAVVQGAPTARARSTLQMAGRQGPRTGLVLEVHTTRRGSREAAPAARHSGRRLAGGHLGGWGAEGACRGGAAANVPAWRRGRARRDWWRRPFSQGGGADELAELIIVHAVNLAGLAAAAAGRARRAR